MDHTCAQVGQLCLDLAGEVGQEAFDQLAAHRVGNFVFVPVDHFSCPAQIPLDGALCGRVVKLGQCAIQFSQISAQLGQQLG